MESEDSPVVLETKESDSSPIEVEQNEARNEDNETEKAEVVIEQVSIVVADEPESATIPADAENALAEPEPDVSSSPSEPESEVSISEPNVSSSPSQTEPDVFIAPLEPESNESITPAAEESSTEPSVPEQGDLVVVVVEDAEPELSKEPEESAEEKHRKEQERLDSMTSYIETVQAISLRDEHHPQLERPGVKPAARRKRTNKQKTFAELEEEERQRQEEARKPREQVDQEFSDPLGVIHQKTAQRSVSIAQEAQNVHAAFMQKAKERKEKEMAENKKKEQAIEEEERASRASLRLSVGRGKKRDAASNGGVEKVEIDLNDQPESAPISFVDKLKHKLEAQGCCVIS